MLENVVLKFRDHAADIHSQGCPQRLTRCTCDRSKKSDDLLREAAARIEVAVEALQPLLEGDKEHSKIIRAAYYALTAARKP